MDARDTQIKGKYNCTSERFKKMFHDHNGHGTHIAGLLLDYAPDAELYIAKIAENKPSNPAMIAQVSLQNKVGFFKPTKNRTNKCRP